MRIDDRMERTARRDCFINIKHTKDGFPNNIKMKIINPTQPEIGKSLI